MEKIKVVVTKLIRVCPGKRHAWYESNVGPIRKEIKNVNITPQNANNNLATTQL